MPVSKSKKPRYPVVTARAKIKKIILKEEMSSGKKDDQLSLNERLKMIGNLLSREEVDQLCKGALFSNALLDYEILPNKKVRSHLNGSVGIDGNLIVTTVARKAFRLILGK